jgi:hypothetical protein
VTTPFGEVLRRWAHKFVPMIVPAPELCSVGENILELTWQKTEDLSDDQANITLYLYGSRGFTHEQVRHRFAISQRSTRYVDEDGSPYIMHPLVAAYLAIRESRNDSGHPRGATSRTRSTPTEPPTERSSSGSRTTAWSTWG